MAKVHIPKSVFENVNEQAIKILRPSVETSMKQEFERIKREMIAEFTAHPVTEEIRGGADATNISGTLGGKYGNLFSFIGFESGDDPIAPIIELLESTKISFSLKRDKIIVTVTMPSPSSIFEVTPMPWASGRSWAKGIELGISGLGRFIGLAGQGRSEGGIQKEESSGGRFKNTQYISALLAKYYKLFTSMNVSKIKLL